MQNLIVNLEEDDEGNLILPIPADILNQMGWDIGDTLLWEMVDDKQFSIRKKGDADDTDSSN